MHNLNNRHRGTCSAGTAGGWDPGVVEVFPSCNDHGTLRLSGSGAPPRAARRGRSAPTAAALRAGRAAPGGRGASARCWAAGRASAEREPPSLFPRRVRAGGAAAAAQGRSVCAALACSLPSPAPSRAEPPWPGSPSAQRRSPAGPLRVGLPRAELRCVVAVCRPSLRAALLDNLLLVLFSFTMGGVLGIRAGCGPAVLGPREAAVAVGERRAGGCWERPRSSETALRSASVPLLIPQE